VVTVVQHVAKVGIKRVNVVQAWKFIENATDFIVVRLLRELDFSRVKSTNTGDGPTSMANSGCFALCTGQNDVDKVGVGGHRRHLFKIVQWHCGGAAGRRVLAGRKILSQDQPKYYAQDISPLLPPLIQSFNPVQPKILEPTAPCFKKRNRNSKQQPHPHLERTKTTQT
tara:strand:+ start:189 stop:695 length:507 start_codon:yes stop_codon:yes gene_type:complete